MYIILICQLKRKLKYKEKWKKVRVRANKKTVKASIGKVYLSRVVGLA